MNWRDSSQLRDKLAAAYALGTLAGPARRRFEAVMASDPAFERAVSDWNRRFEPLARRLPTQQVDEALWRRIEQRSFGSASRSEGESAIAPLKSLTRWKRWLDSLLSPAPAAALMAGLMIGIVLPVSWPLLDPATQQTELPESYVGVLATAQGRPGMIVSSRRHGRIVDLKRVADIPVPAGQTLYLWVLDANGDPGAVGAVPRGTFVRIELPQEAEQIFAKAVELGISLEAVGAAPAVPSLPYAYRGLCGKLWRAAPPPR